MYVLILVYVSCYYLYLFMSHTTVCLLECILSIVFFFSTQQVPIYTTVSLYTQQMPIYTSRHS